MSVSDRFNNESQKEYVARLEAELAAEKLKPRSDDPFGPVDYLASILHAHHSMSSGATMTPWWKVTDEQKEAFRQKAKETVASWSLEQIQAAAAKGAT